MSSPREWPSWLRWSSAAAFLAAVVLVAQAATSLEDLQYWAPAHRGLVEYRVAQASSSVTRSLQSLQITVLQGGLRDARASRIQLEALIRRNPEDLYLQEDLESTEAEIRSLEDQLRVLRCRQQAQAGSPCL